MTFSVIPTRAQFSAHDPLLFNLQDDSHSQTVHVTVMKENQAIYSEQLPVHNGIIDLSSMNLEPNSGYLLHVSTSNGKETETGFDIATNTVRYGFVSDFTSHDFQDGAAIHWLNRLHINYVQFYDWAYRHNSYIAPTPTYTDMMGKKIDVSTLHHLIDACHQCGMKAMAYGAIYGALNEYAAAHPASRLYDKKGQPIPFFNLLSIMNVNRQCDWHDHILEEYTKALAFGFDGIHMDTYGAPKEGYDELGDELDLARDFRSLVNDAAHELVMNGKSPALIFNNVGNWPTKHLATADQTALYIEVWDPYSTYKDIVRLIRQARSFSDLPVVLAAYLLPFSKKGSQEAYNAFQILTAIITSSGATHLINGQNRGLLTQAYYSDYFTVDDNHSKMITHYYDYIAYYAHLWLSRELFDVPYAAQRSGGNNLVSDCPFLSDSPEPGKIWIHARRGYDLFFINFVNLVGSHDPAWNHEQNVSLSDPFDLWVRTDKKVKTVTYSSPDSAEGIRIQVPQWSNEEKNGVHYVKIHVPRLSVWGTCVIR